MRASAVAEKAGVPTVSIVGSAFLKQAALVSEGLGVPLALAEYPGVPMVDAEDTVREKVKKPLLPSILGGLTTSPAVSRSPAPITDVEPAPGSVVFRGTLAQVQD